MPSRLQLFVVKSLAWIGRVFPQPLQLGVPDTDLGQFEEEADHGVVGQDLLCLPQELLALGFVGGEVEVGDDLVEGRLS